MFLHDDGQVELEARKDSVQKIAAREANDSNGRLVSGAHQADSHFMFLSVHKCFHYECWISLAVCCGGQQLASCQSSRRQLSPQTAGTFTGYHVDRGEPDTDRLRQIDS